MAPAALLALLLAAAPLETALRSRIAGFEGEVFLYAKNLDTGASVGIRESERVRTASTIKLPIMLAVFDAVERGEAKWTEPLAVAAAEKVSGSGVLASEISDGVRLPLRDVVHLMIVLSDNTATNMVLERFGTDAVNAFLDKLGIKTTRALRKVMSKAPKNEKYGLGVTTPRDMVAILEKLERGEIVSPQASREMIGILKRCQDDTGIRRRFAAVPVANKTGSLNALRADAGIIYSSGGRIAMSITVDNMPRPDFTPDNAGSLLIADLAKMLVEGLAR